MQFVPYNRDLAVSYAQRWAYKRNSAYYNFDGIGGDCTNFASQCLYAGASVMNYEKDVGWYYISPDDRAAAWAGAPYFRQFLLGNTKSGPYADVRETENLEIGDFIILFNGENYYHTLIVVGFSGKMPLIAAHTNDAYMRRLDTYHFHSAQGLHILGARRY